MPNLRSRTKLIGVWAVCIGLAYALHISPSGEIALGLFFSLAVGTGLLMTVMLIWFLVTSRVLFEE